MLYINFCYFRRYMASSHEHDWDIWAVLPTLSNHEVEAKGKGIQAIKLKGAVIWPLL